jgi:hypothetical protein
MILRSIVILVATAAGTAFALAHPRLPHRVLHVISPAQLEATCPGDFARETSRILNTDAPRRAALVRNPARREWAPKSAGFNPTQPA